MYEGVRAKMKNDPAPVHSKSRWIIIASLALSLCSFSALVFVTPATGASVAASVHTAAQSSAEEALDSSCWYSGPDGFTEHNGCLERRKLGSLRVNRQHLAHLQFDGRLATIFNNSQGWMYVNRRGVVVLAGVMMMDNGPDPVRDGFVRFQQGRKCGYATLSVKGTIIPQFDGCMPFENGKARVCNGCASKAVGEHHIYEGGQWFCIDTNGKRVDCAP